MTSHALVIFDIDGVLVDVRSSYHQVIQRTVPLYLRHILGLPAAEDLIGAEHVAAMKRMGGFNNDWNSVAAMLYTLVAHLPPTPRPAGETPAQVRESTRGLAHHPDLGKWLRQGSQAILDMEPHIQAAGGGLDAVRAYVGQRNAHLVLYGQWDPRTNYVLRIYQELYLGPELFRRIYGIPAEIHLGPGLIDREERIISLETLDTLARDHPLGLVTGRPRVEAEYALRRLGMWDYFRVLVSHDDVVEEMARRGTEEFLGKPHPWPLEAAAHALDPLGQAPVYFVGDTADDMQAAVRLSPRRPAQGIGCTYIYPDKEAAARHLREAGATHIISHPDDVVGITQQSREASPHETGHLTGRGGRIY